MGCGSSADGSPGNHSFHDFSRPSGKVATKALTGPKTRRGRSSKGLQVCGFRGLGWGGLGLKL